MELQDWLPEVGDDFCVFTEKDGTVHRVSCEEHDRVEECLRKILDSISVKAAEAALDAGHTSVDQSHEAIRAGRF